MKKIKIKFTTVNTLKTKNTKKTYTFTNIENAIKKYYQLTNNSMYDNNFYTPLEIEYFTPATLYTPYNTHIYFTAGEIKKLVETKGYKRTAKLIEETACCKGYSEYYNVEGYYDETPF